MGEGEEAGRSRTEEALDVLRRRPVEHALFRGFGPLVIAVLLAVAMVLLLPSVAPERIVERPAASVDAGGDGDGAP